MRKPRCDGQQTRKRLLDEACKLFAELGFYKTTTQEICKKADTNPAAVNYYFKSKKDLYIESWKHAFNISLERYPADGRIPADALAEQRLFGRISSIVRRVVDQENYSFDISHKEMANPTGYLQDALHEAFSPIREGLRQVIIELLGDSATDEAVEMCRHSILSQCFSPLLDFRKRKKKKGLKKHDFMVLSTDKLEQHIFQFSLAGILAVKENIKSEE